MINYGYSPDEDDSTITSRWPNTANHFRVPWSFRVYLKKDSDKTFKFQTIWWKSKDAKIGALFPSSRWQPGQAGFTVIVARLHNVSISHFYSMIMSQHGHNWSGNMEKLKYGCHSVLVDPINMAAGSCKQWQCDSDGMNRFQDPVAARIPFILNFSEQDIASLNKTLLSCSSFSDWIVSMKR